MCCYSKTSKFCLRSFREICSSSLKGIAWLFQNLALTKSWINLMGDDGRRHRLSYSLTYILLTMIFLSRDKIKGEITFLSIYYRQIFYLCLYIYSLQSSTVPTIYSLTNREIRAQNCLGTSQSSPLWRVAGGRGLWWMCSNMEKQHSSL